MKLRKLILPAVLTLGLAGGLLFAGNQQQVEKAEAMASYTGDPDLDCGFNVQRTQYQSGTWEICQFYVNSFESEDVSGGDYFALRIKVAEGAGSYFDFIPNVGGKPHRITISPVASGIKCIPAVAGGEAFDYGGARGFDLPMNLWSGADIWFCIPKAELTRDYWGAGDIDWQNDTLWAVYFMFYGVTQDVVNFDIGDLYTANIDENGRLVKVNRLINWSTVGDSWATDTGDGSMAKLALTRNNPDLKPAVQFIHSIEDVNACNASACSSAYTANNAAYEALDEDNLDYLEDASIIDYANGDTAHSGGKVSSYKAIAKWEQICKLAGHPLSGSAPLFFDNKEKTNVAIIAAISAGVLSLTGLFFFLRKKKYNK